jgi:hypothetical protein
MQRVSVFGFLVLFASCAPTLREVDVPPSVDVASLRAQLAKVTPAEPRGALHVELAGTSTAQVTLARGDGVWLSIAALDLPGARLRTLDARTRVAALDGLDLVHVASDGRFEELRRIGRPIARIEQRYAVTLGPALASLRVVGDLVEALDADGVARLRTEPAFAVDARGVVRPLRPRLEAATRLSWTADAGDLVPPIAVDPAWTATSSLAEARSGAGVFPLPGQRLMVVGGAGDATTEIYDVATASFTMGPSLARARNSIPVQLDDGRIFVPAGAGETVVAGELFDPAKGAWKTTVASPNAYARPVATPLGSARALVVAYAGASIYDAKGDTWVKTGAPIAARNGHLGVRLPDGRALIVAGTDPTGTFLTSAELFDPATGTFGAAGSLSVRRVGFAIAALPDGHVVVAGGGDPDSGSVLDSIEIFDPATKAWSAGPKMSAARSYSGGAVLPDGRWMVAGGIGPALLLSSAEIFDATAKTWTAAGALSKPRGSLTLAALAPGAPVLLAVGGYVGNGVRDVDVFAPLAIGKACTGAGECLGGACVDGVCCEKPACAADETCGGATAPGRCRKTLGAACGSADACGSGQCVDGVCCDRACDGLCEACDVAATKGRCTTLAPGDTPHGAHGQCPGTLACAGLCGGVDAKSCTLFPGAAVACGVASCAAGVEASASFCDGAGGCAPPSTASCEPSACGEDACKRGCAVDGDCAGGYSCDARSGRCVFGAKCDGAHTVLVPGAESIDCTPYRCAGASCIAKCATTDDCVEGTTCDTAVGACVAQPPASGGGGGGGCAISSDAAVVRGGWPLLAFAAALALVSVARARRAVAR